MRMNVKLIRSFIEPRWPILGNGVGGEEKWVEPYELVLLELPLTVEYHNIFIQFNWLSIQMTYVKCLLNKSCFKL